MKPSCCFPLRFVIKAVAILDFIAASLIVLVTSGGLIYIYLFPSEVDAWFRDAGNNVTTTNSSSSDFISAAEIQTRLSTFVNLDKLWKDDGGILATALLLLGLIYSLQKLVLACVLIIAVFQERVKLLRIWVGYSLVILVLSVMGYLSLLLAGVTEPWSIPFYVVAFISREYVIWITTAFLKKVQSQKSDDAFLIRGRGGGINNNKVVYKL
ncbi:uncharacterized protein LOC110853320 [Folsomia candida]|uniref:uncharacterized protein LOC110853320 n=1 Tax=Folsomia candida TaxID=158441 RepID=UPI000B908A6B|nr:uncharacterized protein LOC110853320 [Folsomia candida]